MEEIISVCLTCKKPECDNCMRLYATGKPKGRPTAYDPQRMKLYISAGIGEAEIARKENVNPRTVRRWKEKYLRDRREER